MRKERVRQLSDQLYIQNNNKDMMKKEQLRVKKGELYMMNDFIENNR
jgi:hypothetical protein